MAALDQSTSVSNCELYKKNISTNTMDFFTPLDI